MSKAQEALKALYEAIGNDSVEFTGKNVAELKAFANDHGFKFSKEPNGKIEMEKQTIFKDDVCSVKNGKLVVKKPSYVRG